MRNNNENDNCEGMSQYHLTSKEETRTICRYAALSAAGILSMQYILEQDKKKAMRENIDSFFQYSTHQRIRFHIRWICWSVIISQFIEEIFYRR